MAATTSKYVPDEIDQEIIALYSNDPHPTVEEIAYQVRMASSTTRRRMMILARHGLLDYAPHQRPPLTEQERTSIRRIVARMSGQTQARQPEEVKRRMGRTISGDTLRRIARDAYHPVRAERHWEPTLAEIEAEKAKILAEREHVPGVRHEPKSLEMRVYRMPRLGQRSTTCP